MQMGDVCTKLNVPPPNFDGNSGAGGPSSPPPFIPPTGGPDNFDYQIF